jgi:hypothetical protein
MCGSQFVSNSPDQVITSGCVEHGSRRLGTLKGFRGSFYVNRLFRCLIALIELPPYNAPRRRIDEPLCREQGNAP